MLYKIGKCDYCGENHQITRPSPFMADAINKSMMCEYCWEFTRKEYKDMELDIGDFRDNKDYIILKNKIDQEV